VATPGSATTTPNAAIIAKPGTPVLDGTSEPVERQEVEKSTEGAGDPNQGLHPRLRLKGLNPFRPGGLTSSQASTV